MIIYIIFMMFTLLLSLIINPQKSKSKRKVYLLIVFSILIIISALRSYEVGIDLKDHYYKAFILYSDKTLKFALEYSPYDDGYVMFYKFINIFTTNPQWMIAFHSFLVFSVVGYFIYKNSSNVVLSVMIFIGYNSWFMYLTMLRQSLAVVILLVAVILFNKLQNGVKRYIYYYLMVFVAMQFHASALIMVIYPLISQVRVNRITVFISIVGGIFSFFFYDYLFQFVSSIISSGKDYSFAYANDVSGVNVTAIYGIAVGVIALVLSYLYIYKNKKNTLEDNEKFLIKNDQLVFMVIFLTLTRILRIRLGIIARASEYFLPFLWILLPRVIENISREKDRFFVKFWAYFLFIIAFIWLGYINAGNLYGTVPFKFFWQ